ncbi:hypothetical protein ACIPEQ_13305 [Curtobacterium sp. NPDC087080]|uniref:hypothetical protein n=1 Tax=Curtobacterium sp. NPDC087080 TaxID=3363965 RepID=UPI0037F8B9CF
MAQDSWGPKHQPQYSNVGVPADAADLSQIANFAALVGNRKVDTSTARAALGADEKWPGLQWYDTDTLANWLYVADAGSGSAGWVNPDMRFAQFTTLAGGVPDGGPYSQGTITAVSGKTVGGGFATLANNKITLDPGEYDITWTLKLNVSQPTSARTGYVQFDIGESEPFRAEYGSGGDTAAAKGSFLLTQATAPSFTFYKQGGGTPNATGTIRIRKDA